MHFSHIRSYGQLKNTNTKLTSSLHLLHSYTFSKSATGGTFTNISSLSFSSYLSELAANKLSRGVLSSSSASSSCIIEVVAEEGVLLREVVLF